MPPRKSDASKAATGDEGSPVKETTPREGVNLEDLNLPKSIVTRLAKGVLPPNTQIQGNAMLAMSKSATVFVNYLATHANENAMNQNRKTIAPGDVFKALDDLEFPDFRPRLEMELARFNEVQTNKRNAYRQKLAVDKGTGGEAAEEGGEGPAAKKARMGGGGEKGRHSGAAAGAKAGAAADDEEMGEDEEEEHEEEPEEEEDDEDEDDQDQDHDHERLDVEEQLEDGEHGDAEDEALDNGEDSE